MICMKNIFPEIPILIIFIRIINKYLNKKVQLHNFQSYMIHRQKNLYMIVVNKQQLKMDNKYKLFKIIWIDKKRKKKFNNIFMKKVI